MDDQSFDQLLRAALERTPDQLADPHAVGPHPEPDVLQLLHAQELADAPAEQQLDVAQAELVRAHLATCALCARRFLDFDVPPPVDAHDEGFDDDAGWERVREAVASAGRERATGAMAPFWHKNQSIARYRPWLPLVTAAAGLVVGFGAGRQSDPPVGRMPGGRQRNVEIRPVDVGTSLRGVSMAGAAEATLPTELTLVLMFSVPLQLGAQTQPYDARLVPEGSPTPVRTWTDLWAAPERSLTVDIPPGSVPPGTYLLRLYAANSAEPQADYGLVLKAP